VTELFAAHHPISPHFASTKVSVGGSSLQDNQEAKHAPDPEAATDSKWDQQTCHLEYVAASPRHQAFLQTDVKLLYRTAIPIDTDQDADAPVTQPASFRLLDEKLAKIYLPQAASQPGVRFHGHFPAIGSFYAAPCVLENGWYSAIICGDSLVRRHSSLEKWSLGLVGPQHCPLLQLHNRCFHSQPSRTCPMVSSAQSPLLNQLMCAWQLPHGSGSPMATYDQRYISDLARAVSVCLSRFVLKRINARAGNSMTQVLCELQRKVASLRSEWLAAKQQGDDSQAADETAEMGDSDVADIEPNDNDTPEQRITKLEKLVWCP
jgi:hypothetical protein